MDTFAARLVLARMHAGNMTIQDAAERCGLINQSWSNWEKGMKPRDLLEVVQAISEGLGIDQNWLLFGGPLAKPEPAARRRKDRHGRVGESTLQYPARAPHHPRDRRPATAPTGRRYENDRPRVLRVPILQRPAA